MTTESAATVPGQSEIRAALARLSAIPDFARSPRLASFLGYIVNETLEGRGETLRAYTVAMAVFERDQNFDPHSNSIVRVEATRLRKALKSYYANAGADDPIRIEIPLGGYTPAFSRRAAPLSQTAALRPAAELTTAVLPSQIPAPQKRNVWPLVGGAMAAAVALFIVAGPRTFNFMAAHLGGAIEQPNPQTSGGNLAYAPLPIIKVQPISVDSQDVDAFAIAGHLQHEIADSISRFDEVSVRRGFSRSRDDVSRERFDYELQGQIDSSGHGPYEAAFRLLHAQDNRIVWSGSYNFPSFDLDAPARTAMVRSIVTPIAQPFGIVLNDLRARVELGAPTPKSVECIARFEDFWEARTEAKRHAAFDCVMSAIQLHPNTVSFQVMLANLYIAEYLGDLPKLGAKPALEAAEDAAQRAIRISPGRAHPYLALSQVLNLKRDYEKALRLAERALEINPFDTDTQAQLGAIYILRGKLDQGGQLLRHALESNPSYPVWIKFYLFLDALQRDDKPAQTAAMHGIDSNEEPDVALARVVAAAESGDLDDAKNALARLRTRFPAIAAAPKAALERLTIAPELVRRMLASVEKVGL